MRWIALPLTNERLASVTHIGNGKDADLVLEFASGRWLELAVSSVRVETGHGTVVDVSAWGDTMLKITYTGTYLSLRHGRIGFRSDDERWRAEFVNAAVAWLESDGDGELGFVVDVALQLA